jgi:hypothetical protein
VRPIYLLGYIILRRFQRLEAVLARVVQRRFFDEPALPGETFVFCVDGPHAALGRQLPVADRAILPVK